MEDIPLIENTTGSDSDTDLEDMTGYASDSSASAVQPTEINFNSSGSSSHRSEGNGSKISMTSSKTKPQRVFAKDRKTHGISPTPMSSGCSPSVSSVLGKDDTIPDSHAPFIHPGSTPQASSCKYRVPLHSSMPPNTTSLESVPGVSAVSKPGSNDQSTNIGMTKGTHALSMSFAQQDQSLEQCPLCYKLFPKSVINLHANARVNSQNRQSEFIYDDLMFDILPVDDEDHDADSIPSESPVKKKLNDFEDTASLNLKEIISNPVENIDKKSKLNQINIRRKVAWKDYIESVNGKVSEHMEDLGSDS